MKPTKCKECGTLWNSETVDKCPICKNGLARTQVRWDRKKVKPVKDKKQLSTGKHLHFVRKYATINDMKNKNKKVDPAISNYFRGLNKKSWEVRKANILSKAKVAKKSQLESNSYGQNDWDANAES